MKYLLGKQLPSSRPSSCRRMFEFKSINGNILIMAMQVKKMLFCLFVVVCYLKNEDKSMWPFKKPLRHLSFPKNLQ